MNYNNLCCQSQSEMCKICKKAFERNIIQKCKKYPGSQVQDHWGCTGAYIENTLRAKSFCVHENIPTVTEKVKNNVSVTPVGIISTFQNKSSRKQQYDLLI